MHTIYDKKHAPALPAGSVQTTDGQSLNLGQIRGTEGLTLLVFSRHFG